MVVILTIKFREPRFPNVEEYVNSLPRDYKVVTNLSMSRRSHLSSKEDLLIENVTTSSLISDPKTNNLSLRRQVYFK